MSSSLLLQQHPACLIRLIWIVLGTGGRFPYSCFSVGCCFQDLFNIARSILVQFLSSFFSIRLVSFHTDIVELTRPLHKKSCVLFYRINLTSIWSITLGNNFLLFEYCLDFYKWLRVFLHSWIRKWHPFLSIRSGFYAKLIWKKSDLLTKSITFLWHYQLIFVNVYHPKYVFKRKKNVLPIAYIDYLIETSITVNWMVGIDRGKYT